MNFNLLSYFQFGIENERVDFELNEFNAISLVVFNTIRKHDFACYTDLYKSDIKNLELNHF